MIQRRLRGKRLNKNEEEGHSQTVTMLIKPNTLFFSPQSPKPSLPLSMTTIDTHKSSITSFLSSSLAMATKSATSNRTNENRCQKLAILISTMQWRFEILGFWLRRVDAKIHLKTIWVDQCTPLTQWLSNIEGVPTIPLQ